MKPYNHKNFVYSGISVSSECPFFPNVILVEDEYATVNFNQAYVFNYPALTTGGIVPYIEVYGMTQDYIVTSGDIFYLKLTLQESSSGSVEVSAAELIMSISSPTAEANIFYIKVCEFEKEGLVKEILLRENILWGGVGSGGDIYHPWKVTRSVTADPVSWDIVLDNVYSNGAIATAAINANVVGDNGYILLKIERDTSTRLITTASIIFDSAVLTSDYYTQYRVIAFVYSESENPIIQYQFEEIRIYEELVVENGAFRLQGYEISHRNNYELPL